MTDPSRSEAQRLQALQSYDILDSPPEQSFDDVTAIAARRFGVPMALISLVDAQRQWFKSRIGISEIETPRNLSFCAHAVQADSPLEIPDTLHDSRFASHPMVVGEPFLRFYTGVPIRADDGSPLGTLCVLDTRPRSLSEAERADLARLARIVEELFALRKAGLAATARQRELELQQSMTDRLLESLAEAVVACDATGRLTLFNQTARRWHGIDENSNDHLEWAERFQLFHADGRTPLDASESPLRRARQGERLRDLPICIVASDQPPRYVACNGGPLLDANGDRIGAVIVMHDISERRRIETLKRNFLAAVSHELRTPLTSISGSIDLLLGGAGGPLEASATRMLQIAQSNATRLNGLISDLLDIEKLERGQMRIVMQPVAILPILKSAIAANLGYAASFSVDLQLDPVSVDAQVMADADRLLQVLDNYLSNAAKFSHPAGAVRLRSLLRGNDLEVQVQDHGLGIDPAHHQELFQMFSQIDGAANRRRGGTGLGLSLVRQLVERMGGSVGFESAPGAGSTFWFRLPLQHPDEDQH